MDIGIPKEVRPEEYRVALSPPGVRTLVEQGHRVYVEAGAGAGAHFRDGDFEAAGATVVFGHEEVFARADLVVKVLAPTVDEFDLLRKGQMVAGFLHLATAPPALRTKVRELEVRTLAYERIRLPGGVHPVMAAMSEIAGPVAVQMGAARLGSHGGGRGILLGGASTVPPGKVVVIGAGVAGWAAAQVAVGLGADVTILDLDPGRLRDAHFLLDRGVKTVYAHGFALERAVEAANLLLLAVSDGSGRAPRILDRALVRRMKPGAVLVDLSITEGGASETSRPTRLSEPDYVDEGVVHVCVPNLPSAVARSATRALTHVALPYVRLLADLGLEDAARSCPELAPAAGAAAFGEDGEGRALPPERRPGWWNRAAEPPVPPPDWWDDPT